MRLTRKAVGALRHPITQNALALHLVQLATVVVPLVTLPYTSRVLGSNGFGLVVFAQGFSFVLGVVIGWGFDSWATRDVAAMRDDPAALGDLVARVLGARLILSAGALLVAAACLAASANMRDHPAFLALAWTAAVANGLTPTWFFVGMERLRLVSFAALVLRIIGAALTFALVHHPSDAWIVMALFLASSMAIAIIQLVLVYRMVPVQRPERHGALSAIRSSTALFASSAALTLYTALNVVLLGLFGTTSQVAHFGAAERVIRASAQLLTPAGIVIYPRIVYLKSVGNDQRARRLLMIGGALLGGAGAVGGALLAGLAPHIIRLIYGGGFHEAAGVLRILVLIIPIGTLTAVLATWLMVSRRDGTIVRIALTGGVVNLVLSPILVHLDGAQGMAISVVCAELAVAIGAFVAILVARPSGPSDAPGQPEATTGEAAAVVPAVVRAT